SASIPRTKRSPSPRVSLTVTTEKGVQSITREMIKRLEQLGGGHLDELEIEAKENEEELWVERALKPGANGSLRGAPDGLATIPTRHVKGAIANGHDVRRRPATPTTSKKVDWEIPRKLLHASIGFFTIYLYNTRGDPKIVVFALSTALCIILPADFLRFRSKRFERLYERVLGFLMRECEKARLSPMFSTIYRVLIVAQESINGVVWYILGVNFVLTFYPLDVAVASILILSWADTAASTFGRLWGAYTPRLPKRTPILRLPLAPRKSLAGFIAAAVTGSLIAFGFWTYVAPVRSGLTWTWEQGVASSAAGAPIASGWFGILAISLVAGLVSAVAEALDLGSLDDNLTLPIISGGCLFAMFRFIQWFCS
ncbi:hypothetical protein FISHEDRAFT_8014, partial [Fistulina hepatica ATCC 64428]